MRKVLSLPEFIQDLILKYEADYLIHDRETLVKKIRESIKFYTQPFTPELITELFEGSMQRVHRGIPEYFIGPDGFEVYDKQIVVNDDQRFLMPPTLSDFIRDCQRAGMQLEWKEDIYQKINQ